MALRLGEQYGNDLGARVYPRAGVRPRPIASAFRVIARLVLAIPTLIVMIVLGIGAFAFGIGIGAVLGFMYFTDAWYL